MRLFLSSMVLGAGYLLVYAAFHPDGPLYANEYVLRPWRSLIKANADDTRLKATAPSPTPRARVAGASDAGTG